MSNLAIVIPAYKSTYLSEALNSIASQTCKDFKLYIGDDCSPNNIEEVVAKYRDKIDLVYKRFDTNLGGKDLVAQWERCIDMTQGEEWLWLFSDDDVMEETCVEEFYRQKVAKPSNRLFRFNVNIINEDGVIISRLPQWPDQISAREIIDGKLIQHQLFSFVVEWIVHRNVFFNNGRFEKFDLAWGSDFLTWVKFADAVGGLSMIQTARVRWRRSSENITPNMESSIVYRKLLSQIENVKWLIDFTSKRGYCKKSLYSRFPLHRIRMDRKVLTRQQLKDLLKAYREKIKPSFVFKCLTYLLEIIWLKN